MFFLGYMNVKVNIFCELYGNVTFVCSLNILKRVVTFKKKKIKLTSN